MGIQFTPQTALEREAFLAGHCRLDDSPWRRPAHHQPGITLRCGSGVNSLVANQ